MTECVAVGLPSYPSLFTVGHRALDGLFDGPVVVQEKIDGSQVSFGVVDGELRVRSKGAQIDVHNPPKMFAKLAEVLQSMTHALVEGWIYRGEYLEKPKHNVIAYDRVPDKHVVLFDVEFGNGFTLSPGAVREIALLLGFTPVPTIYVGEVTELSTLQAMTPQVSVLGGGMVEGIVVKNYDRFGPDKKFLIGKLVRKEFTEVHSKVWGEAKPDIITRLTKQYTTEARWYKAVQHLRDAGVLQEAPQDIGPLLKEVNVDVLKECEQDIKDALFKWAWPQISRGITKGLPEWYKGVLAERALA